MQKTVLLVFLMLLGYTFVHGQNMFQKTRSRDSIQKTHQNTIYYFIQESWKANRQTSYLAAVPFNFPIKKRRISLIEGEGRQSDFDVLEANLNLSYPLFLGKNRGSSFNRRQRINFDYNGSFRMTFDDSKPIIPGSHKVGISYYLNFYNNYNGWIRYSKDKNADILVSSLDRNLKFLNFHLQIHHYSNGQPLGFYFPEGETDPNKRRNDYLNGDFSTNYFAFHFTGGVYKKQNPSLHQLTLGYRIDLGDEDSVFAYTVEQEKAYGKQRLFFQYDYRRQRFNNSYEHHWRFETETILGNLDNFLPNIQNNTNKFRTSLKGSFEIAPKNHRAIGYYVAMYYGRDYLNIRYDDIIFSFQIGFTLNFSKFYLPNI